MVRPPIVVALPHHGLDVATVVEAEQTMVRSVAAVTHTTEWDLVIEQVDEAVVDEYTARARLVADIILLLCVVAEVV